MFKEKVSKFQKKLKIKELAQIATEKINENKILLDTLSLYKQNIDIIKSILNRKNKNENSEIISTSSSTENKNNNDESNIKDSIKNEFKLYYELIKKTAEQLRESNQKLTQKCFANNNKAFDENSLQQIDLQKYRTDNFILFYNIPSKNDIIKKLNENILNSRRYSVFREVKRDYYITTGSSENYLNTDNLYKQRDLQLECKRYNKCKNKIMKKKKIYEKFEQNKENLETIINYFQDEKKISLKEKENSIFKKKKNDKDGNYFSFNSNKKKSINNKRKNNMNDNNYNSITIDNLGKKYQFEDDLSGLGGGFNDDQTFVKNKGGINNLLFSNENENSTKNEKKKEKEVKKKFNFLTVDELFDLENDESEKEVIIQDELHSDDEVVFEKKIKNKVRINTMYLSQIKKQVPNLYFNQIEFNKRKIINDADLYSYQRREYYKNDVDENIKLMRKRIKKLRKRIKINKEKLEALIEFDKKAKEKYNVLKPLKVISSLKDYNISFMKREFYNFRKKNDIIAEVDEKNYENEEKKNDDSEDGDGDDYSDEMRKRNKYKNNNDILMTEVNNEDEKRYEPGMIDDYDYENNKPKSK